jgi:hypothetical protein
VLGVLALLGGVGMFYWPLVGLPALFLALRLRGTAKAAGRTAHLATAGGAFSLAGLLIAIGIYVFAFREPYGDYQECRQLSLTFAQDQVCKDRFEDDVPLAWIRVTD